MDDYSKLSDEELKAIIEGTDKPAPTTQEFVQQGFAAGKGKAYNTPEPPDNTREMDTLELMRAGLGGEMNELLQGIGEKAQIAFAPSGKAGQDLRAKIAADRAERKAHLDALYSNPAAVAGQVAGKVIPAVAAPARLASQVLLEGGLEALKPGTATPTGLPSEMMGSLVHGAQGAGTTWGLGKVMQGVGKTAGALTGQTTEDGAKALATRESMRRLGIPSPTVGQLYPGSPSARLEKILPGQDDLVIGQAKALRSAMDKPLKLPEGDVSNVGGAYQEELANAVKQRYALSSEKYKAVDDIIAAKGLGTLQPMYTARSLLSTKSPGYDVATDLLSRYGGFDAAKMQGMTAKQLGQTPLTFADYQTMRVAVNKALNTVDRGLSTAERMGASVPVENKAARKWLSDLKTAMDSDAERWATSNAGNREAVDAFKDATAYFRDVVAPTVIENPIARKATSARSGYKTGEEALRGATSIAGMPLVDRLYPTMTRRGQDMTDVLRNVPDVRATALSKDMTVPSTEGGLGQALRAAGGHPLVAAETAIGMIPGLRGATRSGVAHRLAAAPNLVTGASPAVSPLSSLAARQLPSQGAGRRAAWGALQYPQQSAEEYTQSILQNR